jgi:hypothetical protein
VAIDDPVDLVQVSSTPLSQSLSKRRELTIFAFLLGHHVDTPQAMNGLSQSQPLTIDPKQIGQFVSVTSIGLPFARFLGMNQHDVSASLFSQVLDQPIIEPTHFEDRHELAVHFGQLPKESFDLFVPGTDLPA